MKTTVSSLLSLGFLAAAILLSGGCAQNQQAIARLEQENAQQRERIWQSNRKMEDFRQENEALRQQIATLQNQRTSSSGWTTPGTSIPNNTPAPSVLPSVPSQPPATTLGDPSSPANIPVNPQTGSQATIGGPGKTIRVRKTDSRNVQTVQILPEKTRPIHYEGLHTEFQMKDAEGNIVLAPAPVVIMVTDPTKTGPASRVSQWNYKPEEIADIINHGQAGISVPLDMSWAKSCPDNLDLELHILYRTTDGRLLQQSAKINLAAKSISQTSGIAAAPQGGLTLESANPQIGSKAEAVERPQWGPTP